MALNITNVDSFVKVFNFGIEDYTVFVIMLGISLGIGIYFGFFAGGNDTTDEYLMGGRRMKTWPIAISLVASQLSGISIMTIPAEMYSFGVTFAFTVVSMFLVVPILCYVIIPVFYNNNISNCYEYLEMRFNKQTRQIITLSFILTIYLILPVFIFIPALAFSQVTGIHIHLINGIVSSICVVYTMLGGIKAVVWTDVVQAAIMVVSVVVVGIMGVVSVGGVDKVIDNALEGGRLHINLDIDPKARATLWNCFIGGLCIWTGYVGLNQSCVQRIVALPSLSHARKSLVIFGFGFFIIMFFNCFTGIIMYAKYHDCDPITLKIVEKPDKMMPFFVQDIIGHLKGMPGIFISCVFSAALSTMSASMNSLAGIFYFDYVKPFIKHTEQKANLIMKCFVFFTGFYCILGGFVVEKFSSILQMVITIGGITHGAIFGVFMLGLLVPKANGKATLIALISSMVAMLCIITGAQRRIKSGELVYESLPNRVDGCEHFNYTLHSSIFTENQEVISEVEQNEEFNIFDTSFHWYAIMGSTLVWIIAIPLSFIIPASKKLNPKLLSPIIRPFVEYKAVETEEFTLKDSQFNVQLK